MLKANFKITETGGTGTVQLQSSTDGNAWTTTGAALQLSYGQLTVDDTANVTIDTAIFTPGQIYHFRLVDVSGSPVSNVVDYRIPAILSQATGIGSIDFVQAGADSFDVTFYGTAQLLSIPDDGQPIYMSYGIDLWQQHTTTPIIGVTDTTPQDITLQTGGHGAGIYRCQVIYTRGPWVDGVSAGFTLLRYVKVDAGGNIVADVQLNGITEVSTTGLDTTQTAHILQTGVNYPIKWLAMDASYEPTMLPATGATATLTAPVGTVYLAAWLDWDATYLDDVGQEFCATFHSIEIV